MLKQRMSLMIVTVSCFVVACTEVSSVRIVDCGVLQRFEKAVVRGDYSDAYNAMCPEYREHVVYSRFAWALQSSPYLRKVESLKCSKLPRTGGKGIAGNDCTIKSDVGFVPVNIYLRDMEKDCCIVSLSAAGIPVLGLGSVQSWEK